MDEDANASWRTSFIIGWTAHCLGSDNPVVGCLLILRGAFAGQPSDGMVLEMDISGGRWERLGHIQLWCLCVSVYGAAFIEEGRPLYVNSSTLPGWRDPRASKNASEGGGRRSVFG